ncbi:18881_t:CDS:2, partial [Funneliformis geosporum]
MNLWVENVTANRVIITDLLIKEKARFFANTLNIQENNSSILGIEQDNQDEDNDGEIEFVASGSS